MKNQISFKSNICIVTPQKFKKICGGKYIHFSPNKKRNNIIKSDTFCTYGIRTCTGGGIKNKNNTFAIGFHIWDGITGKPLDKTINRIKNSINRPNSALLIGSKNIDKTSIDNFNKLQKELTKICPSISYFKTFTHPFASADFKYLRAKDTWFINIKTYNDNTESPVSIKTLKALLKSFEEIFISPTDSLFINGKKITQNEAPQIFIKNTPMT